MLEGAKQFLEAVHDPELPKIYGIIGFEVLISVNYENFTLTNSYAINGEGYFLFNYKDQLIIVGEEATPNTGITKTFIWETQVQ